ncbi:MAG: Ig-like domain-containing protein, partial [Actinobacteria bacterium]|nr:Ig-like domain-containing protein [Actinomycetota bacterium]
MATLDNASGIAPATAAMKLDGAPVPAVVVGTSMVFSPVSDLDEGAHLVEATIADRAGNLGAFSGSFSVDRTPPSAAEIASPAAGATLVGIVRFRASASDLPSGVARIDLRANGSNFTSLFTPNFEKDFDTVGLPEGDAVLTARAVDIAGNVGSEGPPVPVKLDNRSITVTFIAPAANLRVRDTVDVWVGVSEPVERVEFEIAGASVVDTTSPYQITLDLTGAPEGSQSITATAFGLIDTGSASRVVVIDRTPPTPPDPDLVFAEPPSAGASLVHGLPGAVEARALVAAVNVDTGDFATTTAGVDGSFTMSLAGMIGDLVSLTAEDDLGNESASTLTVIRSIPSLPPSEEAARLKFEGVVADRV